MKILIAVHSQSGHTASLAKSVADELRRCGAHDVEVKLLRTIGRVRPGARNVELRNVPETDGLDGLVVGGPVWAFGASPVVMQFLNQARNLKKVRAIPIVTMAFPWPALGGRQALRRMAAALERAGADVREGEIVHSPFAPSPNALAHAARRVCGRLTE